MQEIQYRIGELEKAKEKLLEQKLPDLAAKIELEISKLKLQVPQKKNDSSAVGQTGNKPSKATASEASSEAVKQSSDFQKEVDGDSAIPSDSPNDRIVSSDRSNKKWIGLLHEDKFTSRAAFDYFLEKKNRLKDILRNWLNSKRKRDGLSKKNEAIDLAKEMSRIVKNEAKNEVREELLSLKFLITDKKVDKEGKETKVEYFYGCDDTLIDNFFK